MSVAICGEPKRASAPHIATLMRATLAGKSNLADLRYGKTPTPFS
jgi:hypothetical protein